MIKRGVAIILFVSTSFVISGLAWGAHDAKYHLFADHSAVVVAEAEQEGPVLRMAADGERPSANNPTPPTGGTNQKKVKLSGTHTSTEVKKACDNLSNGHYESNQSGYSCVNMNSGASVSCNRKGACTGVYRSLPGQHEPKHRVMDILNFSVKAKGDDGVTSK